MLMLPEECFMPFSVYIRIVLRRGWIVIVQAVVAAGVGYLLSEIQTPVYEASVNLSVRPARVDWDLGQSVGALLRSLAGDIQTYSFLQEMVERSQLEGIAADELMDGRRLVVEADPADYTISITVRDPDPDGAVRAANAIAELFQARRQEWNEKQTQEDRIEVEIRDDARRASVYSPRSRLYVAGGGFLGAVAGAALVAILEWREAGRVRSTRDLEQLGLRALAAIPDKGAQSKR
jgi:uncharacterized protein involved in exopolysaccharide biosynthesis